MNKKLKTKILKLKHQGKSYNDIVAILGCSKSIVCYYCGTNQKEKSYARYKNRHKNNPLIKKIEHFITKINKKTNKIKKTITSQYQKLYLRLRAFNNMKTNNMISVDKILEKIGNNPKCYLTGRSINLNNSKTYHLDHIIPTSRGGSNELSNLEIATREANQAKSDMLLADFIILCRDVLINFGYEVSNCPIRESNPSTFLPTV